MIEYKKIKKLKGLKFINALLKFEEQRFNKNFLKGSVYEEINADFGIFPPVPAYPVYFSGNISERKDKMVFIGINPGYSTEGNKDKQEFLKKYGSFNGYCSIFKFFKSRRKGLLQYFANIKGFLKRFYDLEDIINWDWFHENVISLDFIPYHSENAAGIRINDVQKFRDRYFEAIFKIIEYIKPEKPIFINGFTTFEPYFKKEQFKNLIKFKKYKNFWFGKIKNKYDFIGLPFLTRVKGGKDKLVRNIKQHLK